MDLLLTAIDAVLHLTPGDVLTIPLPEDLTAEQLDTLVGNIRMGSLANHVDVKLSKDGEVQLVTKYDCGCFGVELKAKTVALAFDAPGTAPEKLKLGHAIRTMEFANRFSVVLAPTPAEPAAPPANPPA